MHLNKILIAITFSCGLTQANAQTMKANALAGHYYLQGVREVGSELLLKPNGQFQWMLAYGAVDQQAEGSWQVQSGKVVLTTMTKTPTNAPLFNVVGYQPWGEDEERNALHDAYEFRSAAITQQCKFIDAYAEEDSAAQTAAAAAPIVSQTSIDETIRQANSAVGISEKETPAAAAKRQTEAHAAAQKSSQTLAQAVRKLELSAQSAMDAQGQAQQAPNNAGLQSKAKQTMRAASEAMRQYNSAWNDTQSAYQTAELEVPERPNPKLPAVCQIPDDPSQVSLSPPYQGGHAVLVGDKAQGLVFSNIRVFFHYAHHAQVAAVTNRGGRAYVAGAKTAWQLERITLQAEKSSFPAETIDVRQRTGDVIVVNIDSTRGTRPPFETLDLRIDGAALIPKWQGRREQGRYVKAGQ